MGPGRSRGSWSAGRGLGRLPPCGTSSIANRNAWLASAGSGAAAQFGRTLRSAPPQLCPPLAGVWLAPCFPSGRNFWGSFSITPSREPPGLPASRAPLFPSIPPTECVVLRSCRLPPPVFEALAKPADLTNSLDPSQGDPAMGRFLLTFFISPKHSRFCLGKREETAFPFFNRYDYPQ